MKYTTKALNFFVLTAISTSVTAEFIANSQSLGNEESRSVMLIDVDGDSDRDAIIANYAAPNRVWLNDGTASFSDNTQGLGNNKTTFLAAGDFNGDNHPDLFEANEGNNKVWLNNGSGIFVDTGQRLGNGRSAAIALGDLDADDDLDAVVVNNNGVDYTWINDGMGRFEATAITNSDASTLSDGSRIVALGDIDGDTDLDAIIATGDNGIRILRNNGSGTLTFDASQDQIEYTGPSSSKIEAWGSRSIVLTDVNGDTHLDIIAAILVTDIDDETIDASDLVNGDELIANHNRVWLNDEDGTGSFSDAENITAGPSALSLKLANIDSDSDLDLFLSFEGGNAVYINNDGSFTDSGQSLGDQTSLFADLADLNGDDIADVFTANIGTNTVWLNNGTGTFSSSSQKLSSTSQAVALADLDVDGDVDAITANSTLNEVWLNDGSGQLSNSGQALGDATPGQEATNLSQSIALGDVDGDTDLDAFVANNGANRLWLNNGSGVFSDSGQEIGSGNSTDVALANLDGDSDLDVVVTNLWGESKVWLNSNGNGNFTELTTFLSGVELFYRHTTASRAVSLGDMDGDNEIDAVVANGNGFNPEIIQDQMWLNNGNGILFFDPNDSPELSEDFTADVKLADLDGDTDLDVWFVHATAHQSSRVWFGNDDGTLTLAQSLDAGDGQSVALADFDQDGDIDAFVGNNGPNIFYENDGSGTFTDSGQRLGNAKTVDLAAADLDDDGLIDIYATNSDDHDQIWFFRTASDTIQLSSDHVVVTESDGTATISVSRQGNASTASSIDYSVTSGTAIADEDFTAVSGTLDWAMGDTEDKSFTVTISDDSLTEEDELALIALFNPVNASLGAINAAPLFISTGSTIEFSSDTFQVSETSSSLDITVIRSGSSAGEIAIEYTTAANTADANSDYGHVSGELVWAHGDSSAKTFSIPIYQDQLNEGSESLTVSLFNVRGKASVGERNAVDVTISDNSSKNSGGGRGGSGAIAPALLAFLAATLCLLRRRG